MSNFFSAIFVRNIFCHDKYFAIYPRDARKNERGLCDFYLNLNVLKRKLRGFGPRANYAARGPPFVGEVVPTFSERGCRVVIATDSHGR
jgi:hypothetical protein